MKLSKLLQEAVGKLTQKEPAPFRKPTAPNVKHNPDFVQSEPVGFKKPKEAPAVDKKPTAEKEQKDVIKRNEEQAKISAGSCEVEDLKESKPFQAAGKNWFKLTEGPDTTDNGEFPSGKDDKHDDPATEKDGKTPIDKFTNQSGGPPAPKTPGAPTAPGNASGESEATDQAHKLGLTSKGWGRWADESGKIVAKTVDGKLVKIDAPSIDDYAETGGTAAAKHGAPSEEPSSKLSDLMPQQPNNTVDKFLTHVSNAVQTFDDAGEEEWVEKGKRLIDSEFTVTRPQDASNRLSALEAFLDLEDAYKSSDINQWRRAVENFEGALGRFEMEANYSPEELKSMRPRNFNRDI